MVEKTIGDLIDEGIIKEYIPQGAVTKLKAKPPTRVLQEIFPDVFQAWIDCDTEKHRLQTETGQGRRVRDVKEYAVNWNRRTPCNTTNSNYYQ